MRDDYSCCIHGVVFSDFCVGFRIRSKPFGADRAESINYDPNAQSSA